MMVGVLKVPFSSQNIEVQNISNAAEKHAAAREREREHRALRVPEVGQNMKWEFKRNRTLQCEV